MRTWFLVFALAVSAWATGCASTSAQQGAYDSIDDAAITKKVQAAILSEPALKASNIRVVSYNGDVSLAGTLERQDEVYAAIRAARTVEGVRAVRNHIQLK